MTRFALTIALAVTAAAQETAPPATPAKPPAADAPSTNQTQRTSINLLGQTDPGSGESRRNENVQFNLIDTSTMKELMVRLGTSAMNVQYYYDILLYNCL